MDKNIKSGDEILVDYGDEYTFDEETCISTNRSKYTCWNNIEGMEFYFEGVEKSLERVPKTNFNV